MNLRTIRLFVAAAQEENFRKAAARLHVAQPSLSRHIAELEESLRVRLFEREGRRVRLTAAGQVYLTHAERILTEFDNAAQQARLVASGLRGALQVGFSSSALCVPAVHRIVCRFQEAYPHVDLQLHLLTNQDLLTGLLARELDAGFIIESRDASHRVLESLELASAHWVLAVPTSHRLACAEDTCLADFRGERLIWVARDRSPLSYDRLVPASIASGLVPQIVHAPSGSLALLNLVASGLGVTFTASSVAEAFATHGVVYKPLRDFAMPLHVDLVWKRDSVSALRDRFVAHARSALQRT